MFEVGADTGDTPGEYQYWVEHEHLDTILPFPAGYHDLRLNPNDILAREEYFELIEAQGVIKKILTFIKMSEGDLRSAVESTGAKWYERGEAIVLPWTKHS